MRGRIEKRYKDKEDFPHTKKYNTFIERVGTRQISTQPQSQLASAFYKQRTHVMNIALKRTTAIQYQKHKLVVHLLIFFTATNVVSDVLPALQRVIYNYDSKKQYKEPQMKHQNMQLCKGNSLTRQPTNYSPPWINYQGVTIAFSFVIMLSSLCGSYDLFMHL